MASPSIKILLAVMAVLVSAAAYGEYYQYTDAEGVLRFTDDIASIPPEQRAGVATHRSIKSDPEQPAGRMRSKDGNNAAPRALAAERPSIQAAGTWNERVSAEADELDRLQAELNKIYKSLEMERTALEAKAPGGSADRTARDAYQRKVDALNARIDHYETQYAGFREKEQAFKDRYRR